jgi:hypothetical protein
LQGKAMGHLSLSGGGSKTPGRTVTRISAISQPVGAPESIPPKTINNASATINMESFRVARPERAENGKAPLTVCKTERKDECCCSNAKNDGEGQFKSR